MRLTFGLIFDLLPSAFTLGQVTSGYLGAGMRAAFFKSVLTAASLGFAMMGGTLPAAAADLGLMTSGPGAIGSCTEIVFTCENGRQYPLCPIAVSVVGEVVTASLHTGHRGGTHVRMIPMGVGYRYSGRGVWLDGYRDNALLNFGKHSQIACTIQRS
jgi:hypothetical protein